MTITMLLMVLGFVSLVLAPSVGIVYGGRRLIQAHIQRSNIEITESNASTTRLDAQQEARAAKTRAALALTSLDTDTVLDIEFAVATQDTPAELVLPYRQALETIENINDELASEYSELGLVPWGDPECSLTLDQYTTLSAKFTNLADKLESNRKEFDDMIEAITAKNATFSNTGRAARLTAINDSLRVISMVLSDCKSAFDTAPYSEELSDLKRRSQAALENLYDGSSWETHICLLDLEERAGKAMTNLNQALMRASTPRLKRAS